MSRSHYCECCKCWADEEYDGRFEAWAAALGARDTVRWRGRLLYGAGLAKVPPDLRAVEANWRADRGCDGWQAASCAVCLDCLDCLSIAFRDTYRTRAQACRHPHQPTSSRGVTARTATRPVRQAAARTRHEGPAATWSSLVRTVQGDRATGRFLRRLPPESAPPTRLSSADGRDVCRRAIQ